MKLTDKLSLKFSLKPLAFKLTYKRAKFVDKCGLTHYDFTQSIRFMRPSLRWPRTKRTDGTYLPLSCILQDTLLVCGIAVCNPFREDCTSLFECCNWSLSNEQKMILSSLVDDVSSSSVHVVKEDIGTCRCCGEQKDLRFGVCFDCSSEINVEELVDGVTACSNKGGDVWML